MKLKSLALTGLSILTLGAAAAGAEALHYTIDPVHSEVGFTIRHIFSKVHGKFDKFEGTFDFDAQNPAASKVTVEIDPASINTANTRRDTHLKSADFFDVEKFPKLTFVSSKVTGGKDGKLEIAGQLTMHGVTRPVSLATEFNGAGPGPDGNVRAGFDAATSLNRKDYSILWNKTLDQGSMMLGDDVTINISIEAVQQAAAAAGSAAGTHGPAPSTGR